MQVLKLIKKHAFFSLVFTVAKATVYFVPLILADVLSKEDFGILEYALAGLGMVVNTIINLGVPGAYPYFILRLKEFELQNAFKLHPIILLFPFTINQILYLLGVLNINFYLAFNLSFIIANQVFYSTQLKSHEKPITAVIIDSGVYLSLLLFFMVFKLGVINPSISVINKFVFGYCLVYVIIGIYNCYNSRDKISLRKYQDILKFSVHLLISTFLIFLITTSGRILVEFFFDYELVGVYAFYFRLAAVVVMIHQIVNITFFKKMYTLDPKILDKYYSIFLGSIGLLSISIFFISPYIIPTFSNYFIETYNTYKSIYFLLSMQMIMWIASALNSNIIDRENLASKNNLKFFILVVLSIFTLYLLKNILTIGTLVYIHYTIIFIACLIQYFSLFRKKIYFLKAVITTSSLFILSSIYYFLWLV